MLDYYIDNNGVFPNSAYFEKYFKKKLSHNILLIYSESMAVARRRGIAFKFLKNLDDPIHQRILKILSDFARGDRYSNINLLGGNVAGSDSIAAWAADVDELIFNSHISAARRNKIRNRARFIHEVSSAFTNVLHISESGRETTTVEDASYETGRWEAVAPKRQLLVMQIIRFWVELLYDLQYKAMDVGKDDIPYLNEVFRGFCNPDSYVKTRKTWDTI